MPNGSQGAQEASQDKDFAVVTELAGDEVSREQVQRLAHRYYWAAGYCEGKDVLEVACGNGQGLGYLARHARSLLAGDISEVLLERVRAHYGDRVRARVMDAAALPCEDRSLDVVVLFEALYYLPSPDAFMAECRRVLRPGGVVLIATANKDLYDFAPSLYSVRYYGAAELPALVEAAGFRPELFGYLPVDRVSLRQRVLRPVKKLAVALHLIPRTMAGKRLLKRLVFGAMTTMPAEITDGLAPYEPPEPLEPGLPDRRHKVLYCAATLPE